MIHRALRVVLMIVIGLRLTSGAVFAYDIDTHKSFGLLASDKSLNLETTLTEALGFLDGARTVFAGKAAREWIGDGARFEDTPATRVLGHFHNPLKPWGEAGLQIQPLSLPSPLIQGQSSVLWGQSLVQDSTPNDLAMGGGTWSWPFAREAYRRALTEEEPSQRERAFAETFRALGQLTHLVQDATVPAHARNDPHPYVTLFGSKIGDPDPYESWVEKIRSGGSSAFGELVNALPVVPASSVFGSTHDERAPALVAGLIDTKTFLGVNPAILRGTTIGTAEYTNGNFLSKDTIFTAGFPFPRMASRGDPVLEREGLKSRRYFPKASDGEVIDHFVAEGLLYDSIVALNGAPLPRAFTLTDAVHKDYAKLLLPRAVGYSAALIDHFFRGKLAVDLVPEPDDPTVARLVGTNGSKEPLGSGTLRLFADDGATGRRTAALPLAPVTVSGIAPGGPITSAPFKLPENATAFTAVYEGTLGLEAGNPGRNLPGAVIGKRLESVRVEEVFNDGSRWFVRNPKGVFSTRTNGGPLTVEGYEEVKWGDAPNSLVARTALGPGEPNRIVTYDVPRQKDGVDFVTEADSMNIPLTQRSATTFPFATVVATVDFSQTVQYRQRLARFTRTLTFACVPNPDGFNPPKSIDIGPLILETVNERTLPFNDRFDVVLDLDHYYPTFSAPFPDPYFWWLQEIALDASGRPLGLVVVFLHSPRNASVRLPFYGRNSHGVVEQQSEYEVQFGFPDEVMPLLWALVDLSQGTVVASTAEANITLSSVRSADPWGEAPISIRGQASMHVIEEIEGGDGACQGANYWLNIRLLNPSEAPLPITSRTEVDAETGEQVPLLDGWMRADLRETLAAQGLLTVQGGSNRGTSEYVYDCGSKGCSAVAVTLTQHQVINRAVQFWDARRTRPTPAGERLVFLGLVEADFGSTGNLVVWDPTARSAQVPLRLPTGAHTLGPVASSSALVSSVFFDPFSEGTSIAFLDRGAEPVFFPDVDLTTAYTLIEPGYLYGMQDMRFHGPRTLDATTLPAPLAAAPGNPAGDYHTAR